MLNCFEYGFIRYRRITAYNRLLQTLVAWKMEAWKLACWSVSLLMWVYRSVRRNPRDVRASIGESMLFTLYIFHINFNEK